MLTALNTRDEKVFASVELENTNDFRCSHCNQKVIFRKGTIKTPHFAHKEKCACQYDNYIKEKCGGESELHYNWKLHIKREMEKLEYVTKVDLEVIVGNRIADIVVYFDEEGRKLHCGRDRIIIEVQLSKISLDKVMERSDAYSKSGYDMLSVFWLMGQKNRSLASNAYLGILEDNLNVVIREFEQKTFETIEIANIKERTDIFVDCFISYEAVLRYKETLILKEKLKLCKKLIKDINVQEKTLDISEIIEIYLHKEDLWRKYNHHNKELNRLNSKSNSDHNTHLIQYLNKYIKKIDAELFDSIQRYKELKTNYIERYNIDNEKLSNLEKQILELQSDNLLKERILNYKLTEPAMFDWAPWDREERIEEKQAINDVYSIARSVYELESRSSCTKMKFNK